MRPLKVSCELATPVAGEVPMLDALIEWCMSRHVGRDLGITHDAGESRRPYEPGVIPTPIARRRVPGFAWPVPLATSPIFHATGDWHDHIARRFDADPLTIDKPGVISTTGGEFKGYRLPLRRRDVQTVVWFCVGERRGNCSPQKELRRLLADVHAIGKKTSIGCGRVASWTVEDWDAPEDWCWYAPSAAGRVLMRPLPVAVAPAALLGARPWYGGVVPPYWCADYFADGVTPC